MAGNASHHGPDSRLRLIRATKEENIMTKQEYLNQLQQALAFLDDEARDAAVDFYT